MTKNMMMRIASVLLGAVLITTCIIGGTLAKYTTSYSLTSTSAQVAKWGVTITADGDDKVLFDKTEGTGENISVKASGEYNVVAPGMTGSISNFTISGTPEVAFEVTYDATIDLGDNWMVEDAFYCPLVFTIGGDVVSGLDYNTAVAFENALKAALPANDQYAAGDTVNQEISISWDWAFNGDHVKDTVLGNAVPKPSIQFDLTVTASQLDTYTAP